MDSAGQLKQDVKSILVNPPHNPSLSGNSEEYEVIIDNDCVLVEWEREWPSSGGVIAGLLSSYFEFEHNRRDDDSGGTIIVYDYSDHNYWD